MQGITKMMSQFDMQDEETEVLPQHLQHHLQKRSSHKQEEQKKMAKNNKRWKRSED